MSDIIYVNEALEIFDGRITYKSFLNLIREKKIPAIKAGRHYLLSRQVVENWKRKHLGV